MVNVPASAISTLRIIEATPDVTAAVRAIGVTMAADITPLSTEPAAQPTKLPVMLAALAVVVAAIIIWIIIK